MSVIKILAVLSFRNLFKRKVKTLIVGSIIFFGTFLVVLGTSMLDSLEDSMTKSITGSVAGHLQIYSADAKDDLALFGQMSIGDDDIGSIPNFYTIKQTLSKHPNIKAIVPMGTKLAYLITGAELDRLLAQLREAVNQNDRAAIDTLQEKVKGAIQQIIRDEKYAARIIKGNDEAAKRQAILQQAVSKKFWQRFREKPVDALEFLDVKVAPLTKEGKMFYFRNLGTDLSLFAGEFEQFEVVKGKMVPEGKRGFLISEKFMDDFVKNRAAAFIDRIHRDITKRDKTIADDPTVKIMARKLIKQYKLITYQLSPQQARDLEDKLQKLLGKPDEDLSRLVQQFLTVTDDNFMDRYRFFYEHIAPMIDLYDLNLGDIVTIRGYTQSGYAKAVNVKFYGTFHFKGVEKSDLAGAFNLLDMITFRELLGLMTEKKKKEQETIRAMVGDQARDVVQENIEEALFSDNNENEMTEESRTGSFDEFNFVNLEKGQPSAKNFIEETYTQEQINRGLALNAAIILKDPSLLKKTKKEIKGIVQNNQLNLQVIDWQEATGIIGQFVIVVRIILYTAVLIIYLVALVIINNSMIIATMERVKEIGTMRAMGAPKHLILAMFVIETIFLGLLSGIPGALTGMGLVSYWGHTGIPAGHDIVVFLFGGPRFYPTTGLENLYIGVGVIMLVSIISTLNPAIIATRIQPVVAMQAKE